MDRVSSATFFPCWFLCAVFQPISLFQLLMFIFNFHLSPQRTLLRPCLPEGGFVPVFLCLSGEWNFKLLNTCEVRGGSDC